MNREEFQEGLTKGLKESCTNFVDVDIQYQAPQKGGGGCYPHIFYITITQSIDDPLIETFYVEVFRCEAFFRNGSFSAYLFDEFDASYAPVGSSTSRESVDGLVNIITKAFNEKRITYNPYNVRISRRK